MLRIFLKCTKKHWNDDIHCTYWLKKLISICLSACTLELLRTFGASYPVFLTVLHFTDSEAKNLRMIVLWVALNSIFIILRLCFEIGKITLHIWKKCNTMVTVFCMEVSIGTRVEPIIFAILMTVMPITLAICTTIWSKRKFELLPTIYIMFQNSYTRL